MMREYRSNVREQKICGNKRNKKRMFMFSECRTTKLHRIKTSSSAGSNPQKVYCQLHHLPDPNRIICRIQVASILGRNSGRNNDECQTGSQKYNQDRRSSPA